MGWLWISLSRDDIAFLDCACACSKARSPMSLFLRIYYTSFVRLTDMQNAIKCKVDTNT
jgi:hypothetical protein